MGVRSIMIFIPVSISPFQFWNELAVHLLYSVNMDEHLPIISFIVMSGYVKLIFW